MGVGSSSGRVCARYFASPVAAATDASTTAATSNDKGAVVTSTSEQQQQQPPQPKTHATKVPTLSPQPAPAPAPHLPSNGNDTSPTVRQTTASSQKIKLQTALVPVNHDIKLAGARGLLTREMSTAAVVGAPADLTHHVHASVDPRTGEIANLPSGFRKHVYREPQFGVDMANVPVTVVKGYLSPIPTILVHMLALFEQANGFFIEGVFRVPPNGDVLKQALVDLQNQVDRPYEDPLVIATLIKRWFSQLPNPLLAPLKPRAVVAACDDHGGASASEQISNAVSQVHEPNRSVFLWVLDLLVDVDSMSVDNKMTSRALSVIWAPNLLPEGSPSDFDNADDPTVVLMYAKKMAKFMHKAITWRTSEKPSRFSQQEFFPVDDLGEMASYSEHPAYKKSAAAVADGRRKPPKPADKQREKEKKKKSKMKKKSKRNKRDKDRDSGEGEE